MTATFAPIDLTAVAEPADLADTLTQQPNTPEFNKVVDLHADTVEALRTQQWPIVATEPDAEPQAEPEAEPDAEPAPEAPEAPAPTEVPSEEPAAAEQDDA